MFFGGFPGFEEMGGGLHGGRSKPKEVDNTKFYKTLELTKDCNLADIKKKYKKLAFQHHPDKGGDSEKFKELSRAYEVLSDPEKRKLYDEYGEEGLDGSCSSDPTDIFEIFLGGGRRGAKREKKKGEDITSKIKVTLEQMYLGATRKMAINRDILCPTCEGRGGPADEIKTCDKCNGLGTRVQIRQIGPMIQQTQSMCQFCKGQGNYMPEAKKCKACTGSCTIKERKILEVYIEKGTPNHNKISFRGEADEKPGELPGDVIFIVEQQEHAHFKRRGSDLYMTKKITLHEALTGCQFYIEHFDKRHLLVKTNPGEIIRPEAVKIIRQEGMPIYKSSFEKGHLIIVFDVEFPPDNFFDKESRKKLSQILPLPSTPRNAPSGDLDEYFLETITDEELKARQKQKEVYDDDDDDDRGRRSGSGYECKQQ